MRSYVSVYSKARAKSEQRKISYLGLRTLGHFVLAGQNAPDFWILSQNFDV
jgi:hypothetical protein